MNHQQLEDEQIQFDPKDYDHSEPNSACNIRSRGLNDLNNFNDCEIIPPRELTEGDDL